MVCCAWAAYVRVRDGAGAKGLLSRRVVSAQGAILAVHGAQLPRGSGASQVDGVHALAPRHHSSAHCLFTRN